MANYLYNGKELPALPVWDKNEYPYAFIARGHVFGYHFVVTKSPAQCFDRTDSTGASEYVVIDWEAPSMRSAVIRDGASSWGELHSDTTNTDIVLYTDGLIWANYDIYKDGTIYRSATDPIPLGSATTDFAILPAADYKAACDAIRAKTGKTGLIKSGDMAEEIIGIPVTGRASFNIHYGMAAPSDTSKLWVETNRQPINTFIGKELHGNEVLTAGFSSLSEDQVFQEAAHATVGTKIYIFGGYPRSTSIRVYDTITNTFEILDVKLPTPRYGMAAAVIGTKIYLIGGYDGNYVSEILEFDTQSMTLRKLNSRYMINNTSAVAYNGKVYILGGYGGSNSVSTIKVLDPGADIISTHTSTLKSGLYNMAIALVGSTIYLFGGRSSGMKTYVWDYIQKFNIETGICTMLEARLPNESESMFSGAVGTDIYVFDGGKIMKFDTNTDTLTVLDISYNIANVPNERSAGVVGHNIYLLGGQSSYRYIDKFSIISELTKNVVNIEYAFSKNLFSLINSADAKLNLGVNNVYIGNDNNEAEHLNAYLYRWKESYIPHYTYSCLETSEGTELSSAVSCSVGDLIIACIVTRDTLTLSDGWTLISTSNINSTDTAGNGQRLSFAYKYAEAVTESITVTQASAQRLYINLVALSRATGFVDNGYHYENSSTTSITVERPSGLVLWACSAPSWATSSPYPLWTVSNNSPVLQLGLNTASRLGTVLDQTNDETVTFHAEMGGSTMIVGSLTISGMDKFYTDISGYSWVSI